MGFFKKLFGGGSGDWSGQEDASLSAWQSRLQEAKKQQEDRHSFWKWENDTARELVRQILTEAAPAFGDARVKEMPDDENIELRGVHDGTPVRFAIWMSFGTFWSIDMRCTNQLGEIEVERDHEKIPKEKQEDDPWDEDEERRIFLGKGIFVEGYDHDIQQKLANWSGLPEELRSRILAEMERLDIQTVRSYDQESSLNVKPGLDDLDDPIAYMQSCASLLAGIRDAVQTATGGAQDGADGAPAGPSRTLTCAYCSSLFVLAAGQNTCPNCGAPARST